MQLTHPVDFVSSFVAVGERGGTIIMDDYLGIFHTHPDEMIGAGRPKQNYAMHRQLDEFAREVDKAISLFSIEKLYRNLKSIVPHNVTIHSLNDLRAVTRRALPSPRRRVAGSFFKAFCGYMDYLRQLSDRFRDRIHLVLLKFYDVTSTRLQHLNKGYTGVGARSSNMDEVEEMSRQLFLTVNSLDNTVSSWEILLDTADAKIDPGLFDASSAYSIQKYKDCQRFQNVFRLVPDVLGKSRMAIMFARAWWYKAEKIRRTLNVISKPPGDRSSSYDTEDVPTAFSTPSKKKSNRYDDAISKPITQPVVFRRKPAERDTDTDAQRNTTRHKTTETLGTKEELGRTENERSDLEKSFSDNRKLSKKQLKTKGQRDRAKQHMQLSDQEVTNQMAKNTDGQNNNMKQLYEGETKPKRQSPQNLPNKKRLPDRKTTAVLSRQISGGYPDKKQDESKAKIMVVKPAAPIKHAGIGRKDNQPRTFATAEDKAPPHGKKLTNTGKVMSIRTEPVQTSWQAKKLDKLSTRLDIIVQGKQSQRETLDLLAGQQEDLDRAAANFYGSYLQKQRLSNTVSVMLHKVREWKKQTDILNYQHQLWTADMNLERELSRSPQTFEDAFRSRVVMLDLMVARQQARIRNIERDLGLTKTKADRLVSYEMPYHATKFPELFENWNGFRYGYPYSALGEETLERRTDLDKYRRSRLERLTALGLDDADTLLYRRDFLHGEYWPDWDGTTFANLPRLAEQGTLSSDSDDNFEAPKSNGTPPEMYDPKRNERKPHPFITI